MASLLGLGPIHCCLRTHVLKVSPCEAYGVLLTHVACVHVSLTHVTCAACMHAKPVEDGLRLYGTSSSDCLLC